MAVGGSQSLVSPEGSGAAYGLERAGTAAQVRIDSTVDPKQHVTDFLSMVRVDGKWRIVSIIDY